MGSKRKLPDAVAAGRCDDDDALRQDGMEVTDDVDAGLGIVEVDNSHERLVEDVRPDPKKSTAPGY